MTQSYAALDSSHLNIQTILTGSLPPVHWPRADRVKIQPRPAPAQNPFTAPHGLRLKPMSASPTSPPCLLRHGPPVRPHLSPPLLPTPTRDAGLPRDAPGSRLFPCTFLCPLCFFSFGRTQSCFSFKTQLRRPFSRSLSWIPTPSPRYSSVVVCTIAGFFTLSLC